MENFAKNILLIAGTGRNVGKTLFACKLIKELTCKSSLVGIKISPHFHKIHPELEIIEKETDFLIAKETNPKGNKDSNRLLSVGCNEVYYIQAKDSKLHKALSFFEKRLCPESPVICESGGMRELIKPGLFLMIGRNNNATEKSRALVYKKIADQWIEFNGDVFNFEPAQIVFTKQGWKIKKTNNMITFHEALKTVKHATRKLGKENIQLADCLNRVLAEDVHSDMCIPPFNKSAMDGYACKSGDLSEILEVIELVAAGTAPQKTIAKGQCSKIMTGAIVPNGADTVIMVEHTEQVDEKHIRFTKTSSKPNICIKGEDIQEGAIVLTKGTRLKAQHISVLSSVGCTKPLVYRKPKVAIIATGSELVEPHQQPNSSQIRNVNSWQLQAQLQKMHIAGNYYGIVADCKEETKKAMAACLEENDVLIISGGVSVGDYDYVPQILKELGFNIWFHTLAVKPGKHTVFATCKDKYVFGMPGNPVSSFVQFELLGRPLLYRLMGHDYNAPMVRMPIAQDYKRKRTDRLEFIPVRFNANNRVVPISYHGSAHINAFTFANGIMAVPRDVDEFTEGEFVHVRQV